jgi:hypothetical protein
MTKLLVPVQCLVLLNLKLISSSWFADILTWFQSSPDTTEVQHCLRGNYRRSDAFFTSFHQRLQGCISWKITFPLAPPLTCTGAIERGKGGAAVRKKKNTDER